MSLENFVEDDNQDIEIDDASSNKSVLENIKGSDVWKYFTRDVNFKENKKAKCDLCSITYVCTGGSTTNMHNHIKNKHSKRTSQEISIKDAFNVVPKVNILSIF
jgi:radical SAM protein with 4Fe4S-binding SPASM domain